MKTIYENLDTSFVNLPALVRFLRGKNFAGNVRVELKSYEAEIVFDGDGEPKAREHDRNAGRIAEGEQALQRALIRAREPGGIINVYQKGETSAPLLSEKPVNANQTIANEKISEEIHKETSEKTNEKTNEKAIYGDNRETLNVAQHRSLIVENALPSQKIISDSDTKRNTFSVESKEKEIYRTTIEDAVSETKSNAKPTAFPFEFSNKVETKAKQNQLSDDDWKTLLSLIGELLRTIDEKLASANLNFPAAFQKACAEVSEDYPFLNPNSGTFAYRNGKIEMRETVNAKLFVAGINETLRRILLKLGANRDFAEAERETVQSILALIHHRKPLYDKFYITPQLEKTLRA